MSTRELPTVPSGRPRSAQEGRPQNPAADGTERSPLVLGRYRLRRRLGAGAFGTVWAAHDERLEREVAVKILPRDRIVGGRFEQEARVAARLGHPAIVTLYEAAVDDEGGYLVSELVRGATLARLLETGKLSDRDIVRMGISLCDALAHAHAEAIVHRDVKPSNVLVPTRPSSPEYPAKLTDFGVAQVVGGTSSTRTGDIVGTEAYMAPEQADGLRVGPEADLYALALVIYESLTGVNPLSRLPPGARRRGLFLAPLRRQRRDLPRELGAAVDQALRPRPNERGTIADLRQALQSAAARTGDQAGVVAPPWRPGMPTLGATRVTAPPPRPVRFAPQPTAAAGQQAGARTVAWATRGLAATAAAGAVVWIASLGLFGAGLPPAADGVIAALLVLLLPRLGWIATVAAVTSLLIVAGRTGAALIVGPLLLLPIALSPVRGRAWPLAAGAVGLGLLGVALGWPAFAARLASSAWERAAIGASGFLWLVGATQLSGSELFLRRAPSAVTPALWTSSPGVAIDHVLPVLVSDGALAGALVWGAAAMILPWLTRGRRPVIDALATMLWSAALLSGTAFAAAAGGAGRFPGDGVAVAGALVGAVAAMVPALRFPYDGGGVAAELP